ncbi:MAG: hypothetical protein ABI680_20395, partial [Chthoniobacteraceae bacterium]
MESHLSSNPRPRTARIDLNRPGCGNSLRTPDPRLRIGVVPGNWVNPNDRVIPAELVSVVSGLLLQM